MPKMKTKSAVKKRFKITGTGKVKAGNAFKRHCMGSKPQKMKRTSRGTMVLAKPDGIIIKRFMPYGRP
jgi:large subunit ribosomal protein L35